jgi:hypothetical protein
MPVESLMNSNTNEESSMPPQLGKDVEELVESVLRTVALEPTVSSQTKVNIEDIDEASQKWYSNLSPSCRESIDAGIKVLISGSLSAVSHRILDDELKKLESATIIIKDDHANNTQSQISKNQSNQSKQHEIISDASQKKNNSKIKSTKGNAAAGSKQSRSNNNSNNNQSNNSKNSKPGNNNSIMNRGNSNTSGKYRKLNGPIGNNVGVDHRGGDNADHRVVGKQRRWPSPDHDHRRSNSGPNASMGHYHRVPYGSNVHPPFHMHPLGGRHPFPILPPHGASSSHYFSGPGPPKLGAGNPYHPPPHRSAESHSPAANVHPNQHPPYNTGYFDDMQNHAYFDARSASSGMHHRGQPSGFDDRLRSRSGSRTVGRINRRETSPSRSQSNSHYKEGGDRDRDHNLRFQNENNDKYGGKDIHGRDTQHDSRRPNDRSRNDKADCNQIRNQEQKSNSGVSRGLRDIGETVGSGAKNHSKEGYVRADELGKQEESTEVSLGENESRSSSRGRKSSSRKSERKRQHRSRRRSRSSSTSDGQPRHQHSSSSRKRRRRSRSSSASSYSAGSSDESRSQKKSYRRRSDRHKRSSRKHRNSASKDDDIGSIEKSINDEGRHRRSSRESPRKRKKREKTKHQSSVSKGAEAS